MHFIGFIVFGFVVGLLARLLLPGRQHMGVIRTSLLGMGGAVLAGWIGQAVGWYAPGEGPGYLMSIGGAIVLLLLNHVIFRNRSRSDKGFRKAA